MTARKVGLLLLILGFGAAVETAWSVREHLDLGPAGCRVLRGKFYGPSFAFEEETTHEVARGVRLSVDNAFGAVRVTAGAPGRVKVGLRKVVFLPTEARAKELAARIRLEASTVGDTLRLGTNRAELSLQRNDVGFETHLTIEAPPETAVAVENEHGRVDVADVAEARVDNSFEPLEVSNVRGPADLKNRHGGVEVRSVGGTLSLQARHGDVEVSDVAGRATLDVQHGSVQVSRAGALTLELAHGDARLETIRGDLEVRAKHGAVRATDVTGNANVETTYNDVEVTKVGGEARLKAEHGAVGATEVKGALAAEASFNDVTLDGVEGPVEVEVSHGGVRAHALAKGARVRSSGDDVTLDGFRGRVEIESSRGGVELVPAGALTEPVMVRTTHGGIRLEVPSGSRFDLEVSAQRGEIMVDVPGLVIRRTDNSRVSGTLGGGGNPVKLSTEGGDVTLESRSRAAKDEQ